MQELTIADADGSVAFRTAAPVLGLGEGGPQFDRRGEYYRLVNGQISPLLATHGGTIRVASQTGQGATFTVDLPIPTEVPS